MYVCVCALSKNTHISQFINFQICQHRLLSCHTHLTPAGVLYILYTVYKAQLYHTTYSITHTEEVLFSVFIFLILSLTQTLMDTQHTHCTVERQRFPLTSMSPDCDMQPRSAVISGRPGEGAAVEKFKQHAHKHTQIYSTCTCTYIHKLQQRA